MQINWLGLADLLAFSRAGSVEDAALALAVDPTTLLRRLRRLEKQCGVAILTRRGRRYELALAGRELAAAAENMEREVHGLSRNLARKRPSVEGTVRLTALRSVLQAFVIPKLPSLRDAYPDLVLELIAEPRNLSLSRLEADIAIRFARPEGHDLVARKLFDVRYAVYGARDSGWVTYESSLQGVPEARWIAENADCKPVVLRANGIEMVASAVRAGVGRAVLPEFAAAGLKPQSKPVLKREMWLVLHSDTRATPRIRAVADWLVQIFRLGRTG